MQNSNSNSEQIVQAVFSVCASSDVSSATLVAVNSTTGAEFAGEFREYITADKRPQFSQELKDAIGCVALVDCDRDPELALKTMERLQQIFFHKIRLIAVATQTDAGYLLRAMRAGCSEFLNKPLDAAQLSTALTRFQSGDAVKALTTQEMGKVISFYGVKGGVGATTLAVHLAMNLVKKHRKKVLLIDHKHELGHVALYLGIKESKYYFDELIRNVDRLDSELLEGLITRHKSGLEAIPSRDTCALPHETPPRAIERIMDYLRHQYDYILLDSSMQYSSTLAAIMTASDEVSLICTPDVASLRDLVRHIEHLSLVNGFTNKLRVIINRSTSNDAVTPEQIETAVRFPISVAVPNNYMELLKAINSGDPISPDSGSAFTQAIAKWGRLLVVGTGTVEDATKIKKRFSLFGRPGKAKVAVAAGGNQ